MQIGSMLKYLVVIFLKIILRIILHLLGVTNTKIDSKEYYEQDVQFTQTNSLQPGDSNSTSPPKQQIRDTGKWNGRNIHICDESSESDTSFRIPRKPITPITRRYLQSAMSIPMTSSPLHVLSRQYSPSSGISTASDDLIPGIDTDDSFPEYNHLLDSVFEKRDATESENIKLKAALDELTREKLRLQDKIIQQHERLLCKKLESEIGGDYAKHRTSSAFQLYHTNVKNISMQDSASELCKIRRTNSSTSCTQACNLNRTAGNCRQKCDGALSSGAPHYGAKADELLEEHRSSFKADIRGEAEMLEKIEDLENENIRLKEYINGLLYMVLENSPSILESNQEYMQDGCP